MTNLNTAVFELHQKGYSYNQIAKELGISKSKAYRIINKTVDISKAETIAEYPVSRPDNNIPKQPERAETGKKYNADNLKLQVKLRKLELEHEAEMKRLDLEEQERKREFESENNVINNENLYLKNQMESFKEQIEKLREKTIELEQMKISENLDDDYEDEIEDEYEPELDIMIKDEIKEFLSHILITDKYYTEDLEELIIVLSNLKTELIEQAENENVDAEYFEEFNLLKATEKVINHYQENFDDYTSFFGSTINLSFDGDLYSQIEEYANNDSEE